MVVTLFLLVCSIFICSSYGNHSNSTTGFIAKIVHSNSLLSHTNVTQYDWARAAFEQSKERISYHAQKRSPKGIFIPTTEARPAYLMIITIGYPEQKLYLLADTGSSLTWIHCEGKSTYNPRTSSTYESLPCSSQCLDTATDFFDCEDGRNCKFKLKYGDGRTQISGKVGKEMFRFSTDIYSDNNSWDQLIFGCGNLSMGNTERIAGIVGLNRNKVSLISQLSFKKFSYCFSPGTTMYMRFGSYATIKGETTPMLQVPGSDHFYLYLKGISVGSSRLDLRRDIFNVSKYGSGGFIIDTGTTLTMIEPEAFRALKKALVQQSRLPIIEDSDYEVCFSGTEIDAEAMPSITFHFSGGVNFRIAARGCFSGTEIDAEAMPSITFHFSGGVNFRIAARGAFKLINRTETICLMFRKTIYRGINILGNMAQEDHNIGYDLDRGVISFIPFDCHFGP